jgi:hypothetical protein
MTDHTRKNIRRRRGKHGPIGRKAAGASDNRGKAQAPAAKPKRSNANPQANFKRYMDLAREAASAGDKVQSEYYYQHADHYHRLITQS